MESVHSRDRLLANLSLYWFTGAIGSSFWPYYARMHGHLPITTGERVDVPMGYCAFPHEIIHPPPSVAATMYTDSRRWTPMAKGGHFAAMEQPEALAREIVAFYCSLRYPL
jgi:pimeloyl-ACP methyl ester carboxylesterase